MHYINTTYTYTYTLRRFDFEFVDAITRIYIPIDQF